MTYPKDFIAEVKRVFPRISELHHNLDTGQSAAVGNFLIKEQKMKFSTKEAIDLFGENRENELLLELRRMETVEILLEKWRSFLGNYSHP